MHPAEHRGYRELHAATGHLEKHWQGLAERLSGTPQAPPLRDGADAAAALRAEIDEAMAERDLYGGPASQAAGRSISVGRNLVSDRFLERNQAARLALLDVQHVTTLLAYLGRLARTRGDAELGELCDGWQSRMKRVQRAARHAAIETGDDPDGAIARADSSPIGAAAHTVASAVGTAGEWTDRRLRRLRHG
jgi:hypothetical protein